MLKQASALFAALSALALVTPASAEDQGESGPGFYRAPVVVVYGRPDRPHVQIVVKTPTAAAAASEAHATLHAALWAVREPAQR